MRTTGQARAHSQLQPCTGGRGPRWPAERESRQTTDSSAGRSSPPTGPQRRLSASRMARKLSRSSAAGFSISTCFPAFAAAIVFEGCKSWRRYRPPECARRRGQEQRSGRSQSPRPDDPSPRQHAPPTRPAGSKSQPRAPADQRQTPAHAQPPPTQPHAPPPRIAAQPNPPATAGDSTHHPQPPVRGEPGRRLRRAVSNHPFSNPASRCLSPSPDGRGALPSPRGEADSASSAEIGEGSSGRDLTHPHPDHPTIPSAQTNPDEPVESNNPPVAP